jgi:thymidylate synthase
MVGELLWFIEGSRDERRLAEITHGSRDGPNTIWTENAKAPYWIPRAEFPNDLGRVYGVQWRSWRYPKFINADKDSMFPKIQSFSGYGYVDQLYNLIEGLKKDPSGRRHIITAWNPAELDLMALPPCHILSQFDVTDGKLNCQMYQRSVDSFLGLPFNIASYSLLTHLIAQDTGYEVGDFVWVGGDVHIYKNHINQVIDQLQRQPYELPTLKLNPEIKSVFNFKMSDIELIDYKYHPPIKAQMAV